MKKVASYILGFIFLTLLGSYALDYAIARQIEYTPPYCLSFASIGAIFQESRLNAWATIKMNSGDIGEEKRMRIIEEALGLSQDITWFKESQGGINKYVYSQEKRSCTIVWKATKGNDSAILITINSYDPAENLENWARALTTINGYDWTFNYSYRGVLPSAVGDSSVPILIDTMLKNMKVDKADYFIQGDSWSVQGIPAPQFRKPAGITGEMVQVAMRREKQFNRTSLWIGIPYVLNSY